MSPEHDNPYWRRKQIDQAIDWRKQHLPWDISPVRVRMKAAQLHEALGYPLPRGPHPVPSYCTYRGFRIEATVPDSAPGA